MLFCLYVLRGLNGEGRNNTMYLYVYINQSILNWTLESPAAGVVHSDICI